MTEKEAAKIVRDAGAKLRAAIIAVNGDEGDLGEITDLILGYDGYKRFDLEGVNADFDKAYKIVGAVMVDALLEMGE